MTLLLNFVFGQLISLARDLFYCYYHDTLLCIVFDLLYSRHAFRISIV